MSVLAQPNHPARLLFAFAAGVAVAGIIGLAAGAVLYVVDDQRTSEVAGIAKFPRADVNAPEGLIVVVPVADEEAFEAAASFAPVMPVALPATTDARAKFFVTPADDEGRIYGHVRYSALPGAGVDGISGPTIALVEQLAEPGPGANGEIRQIAAEGVRVFAAAIPCGRIVIDAQFFFQPEAASSELALTPRIEQVIGTVMADLRSACDD